MGESDQVPFIMVTPEMREAVRQQIVVNRLRTSDEIASALDLRHDVVVRMLERFAAVRALRVQRRDDQLDGSQVDLLSVSAWFRDLDTPLWLLACGDAR